MFWRENCFGLIYEEWSGKRFTNREFGDQIFPFVILLLTKIWCFPMVYDRMCTESYDLFDAHILWVTYAKIFYADTKCLEISRIYVAISFVRTCIYFSITEAYVLLEQKSISVPIFGVRTEEVLRNRLRWILSMSWYGFTRCTYRRRRRII